MNIFPISLETLEMINLMEAAFFFFFFKFWVMPILRQAEAWEVDVRAENGSPHSIVAKTGVWAHWLGVLPASAGRCQGRNVGSNRLLSSPRWAFGLSKVPKPGALANRQEQVAAQPGPASAHQRRGREGLWWGLTAGGVSQESASRKAGLATS